LSSGALTTQFSGQAFKADAWNLIGFDLNTASETGTFNSASIASEKTILTGAATGTYYLDASYLRGWQSLDYWYYSIYNIVQDGSSSPDKEYFIGTSESATDINTADDLLGDTEWIDLVMCEAMEKLAAEVENVSLFSYIMRKKAEAQINFDMKYPNMTPLPITQRTRFNNNPQRRGINNVYDN